MYEETTEPNPCAGLQSYLILKFTANDVVFVEKDVSGCGEEYITHQGKYQWRLGDQMEILFKGEEKEIQSTFMNDLTLLMKDGALVGYQKINSETTKQFDFEESSTKE